MDNCGIPVVAEFEELFKSSQYDLLIEKTSQIEDQPGIEGIRARLWKGRAIWELGQLELAIDILNSALTKYQSLTEGERDEYVSTKADLLNYLGNCHIYQNNFELALQEYDDALDIYESINDAGKAAKILNNIAVYHHTKGDFSTCLNYIKRSLLTYQRTNDQFGMLGAYHNLAGIYMDMAELQEAKEYLIKTEQLAGELNNLLYLGSVYNLYGLYYHYQDMHIKAIKHFEIADNYYQELGNHRFIAKNYESLINTLIREGEKDTASQYLLKLKELEEREDNIKIYNSYMISKARMLQNSHRLMDKGKATEIYKQMVSSEVMERRLDAIEGLIELLLEELLLTKSDQTIEEISELFGTYTSIAQDQHLYLRLIRILVFRSRFNILKGNLERAQKLLLQAQTYAREKGLKETQRWIELEYTEFESQFENWKDIISGELTERIEKAQMRDYIDHISNLMRR